MDNCASNLIPELTEKQSEIIDSFLVDMSVSAAALRVGCSEIEAQAMLSLEHVHNRIKAILDIRSKHINVDKYFIEQSLIRIFHSAESEGKYKEAIAALKLIGDINGVYAPKSLATAAPQILFTMPPPGIDPDANYDNGQMH